MWLANIYEGLPNSNVYKDVDIFANTHKIAAEIEVIKSYAIISKAIANKSLTTVVKRQGKIKDTELFSDAPFKVASVVIPNTYYDKPFTLSIKGDGKVSIIDPMGQSLESYLGDTLMWNETCHLSLVLNTSLLDSMPDIQIVDTYTVTFNSEEAAVK